MPAEGLTELLTPGLLHMMPCPAERHGKCRDAAMLYVRSVETPMPESLVFGPRKRTLPTGWTAG